MTQVTWFVFFLTKKKHCWFFIGFFIKYFFFYILETMFALKLRNFSMSQEKKTRLKIFIRFFVKCKYKKKMPVFQRNESLIHEYVFCDVFFFAPFFLIFWIVVDWIRWPHCLDLLIILKFFLSISMTDLMFFSIWVWKKNALILLAISFIRLNIVVVFFFFTS